MAKKKTRKPLTPRSAAEREALALQPLIDDLQDSLDRFRVMYEEGGNIDAAMADLAVNYECLADGVDKIEVRRPARETGGPR